MFRVTLLQSSQAVFVDAQNNTSNIVELFESENGFVFKLDAVLSPPPEYIQTGDPNVCILYYYYFISILLLLFYHFYYYFTSPSK